MCATKGAKTGYTVPMIVFNKYIVATSEFTLCSRVKMWSQFFFFWSKERRRKKEQATTPKQIPFKQKTIKYIENIALCVWWRKKKQSISILISKTSNDLLIQTLFELLVSFICVARLNRFQWKPTFDRLFHALNQYHKTEHKKKWNQ